MTGLAPYIAAGFAAAFAVTTLEFSLVGSASVAGFPQEQAGLTPAKYPHPPSAPSRKGDLLVSHPAAERVEALATVALRGPDDSTIVLIRGAAVRPRKNSARSPYQRALPEGCDPALSSMAPSSASDSGTRCLVARDDDVKIARLFD